jgi:hypothetical protein
VLRSALGLTLDQNTGCAVDDRKKTIANGWNRPKSAIQVRWRERPLPDRKADIAYDEIIVRCSNQLDCPLSYQVRS